MNCKICQSPTRPSHRAQILNSFEAQLCECTECGFVFYPQVSWLKEAYSEAISKLDTGIVYRNLQVASFLALLLKREFPKNASGLDRAGGFGLLTRLMRDCGYDWSWSDLYADNLFAKGFEEKAGRKYTLVTAIEAFEHYLDPMAEFEACFARADNLFLMTTLIPDPTPSIEQWPYYQLQTGQHISFFRQKTLAWVAKKFNKNLVSFRDYHFIGDKEISLSKFKLYDILSRKLPVYKMVQKSNGARIGSDAELLLSTASFSDRL